MNKQDTPKPKVNLETVHKYLESLKGFWGLYTTLLNDGWFDDLDKILKGEEGITKEIADYGKTLIRLIKKEKDIIKKYSYFEALKALVEYLGGELGNDRPKEN